MAKFDNVKNKIDSATLKPVLSLLSKMKRVQRNVILSFMALSTFGASLYVAAKIDQKLIASFKLLRQYKLSMAFMGKEFGIFFGVAALASAYAGIRLTQKGIARLTHLSNERYADIFSAMKNQTVEQEIHALIGNNEHGAPKYADNQAILDGGENAKNDLRIAFDAIIPNAQLPLFQLALSPAASLFNNDGHPYDGGIFDIVRNNSSCEAIFTAVKASTTMIGDIDELRGLRNYIATAGTQAYIASNLSLR